ncbi:MAG: glucose-6-phosphate dehydrogenase [Thermoplasmata archaeon]|nr:glucose-6-phosphate dehydrogenase [Thermoplasmata archaeon]MCI4337922.1 glucose-6-phosphate dehydrogenase [Thermoplasmata archaeon]MCI4342037.1 glucose-6-phosphate dehydrogenase [Thermoplasmata archaeon]
MARAPPEPHLFVVFGATGDLMQRKLLPSLFAVETALSKGGPPFRLLGCARQPLTEREFRSLCLKSLRGAKAGPLEELRRWVDRTVAYASLGDSGPDAYAALRGRIEEVERGAHLPGNRVFYLALPSEVVGSTVEQLGAAGLHRSPGWSRLVVEKPFGRDYRSAVSLNRLIHRYFHEKEVYRIDHYLGKETVQNLLVFRFANMLFESVWNRDRIDHVEITVAEDLGVEHRAGYYDHVGALRDMVQSHLLQLLTLTAMEVPASLDPDQVRNEKVKVLRTLEPIRPSDVVLGQYTAGRDGTGKVPGYRQEPGVARRSKTETFVAMALQLHSWRWHGIPFYLRTGKRLPSKVTEIVVRFREPPVWFFPERGSREIHANRLTITLQPNEGFMLSIELKRPGQEIELVSQRLHFQYAEAFGPLADSYQTLLLDVMEGDQTLFVRADEVEEAWRVLGPVLESGRSPLPYAAGSWGPPAARALVEDGGHHWTTD